MNSAFYEEIQRAPKAHYGTNMNFSEHLHKQIEIVYILEGEMLVKIGRQEKILVPGELGIAFPNTIHGYETREYCRHIMLIIELEIAGDFQSTLTRYGCENPFLEKEQVHADIPTALQALTEDELEAHMGLVKGYIGVLLGNILRSVRLKRKVKGEEQDLLHAVMHYITRNYLEPITLEDIAAEVGAGKYTVSRLLNESLENNLNDYVNNLRVSYAQHLLSNTKIPITNVAYESGFGSQRTFNRAFREHCGLTPREYRQQFEESRL